MTHRAFIRFLFFSNQPQLPFTVRANRNIPPTKRCAQVPFSLLVCWSVTLHCQPSGSNPPPPCQRPVPLLPHNVAPLGVPAETAACTAPPPKPRSARLHHTVPSAFARKPGRASIWFFPLLSSSRPGCPGLLNASISRRLSFSWGHGNVLTKLFFRHRHGELLNLACPQAAPFSVQLLPDKRESADPIKQTRHSGVPLVLGAQSFQHPFPGR